MKTNIIKTTGLILSLFIVLSGALFLTGCEDTIMPLIEEEVRLAELPEYTLTILDPAYGSVTPDGVITVKGGEPVDVSASAPGGYSFVNWQQISGVGIVTFVDENSPSTSLSLSGGDATIQPVISDTLWNLTIGTDGNGTTNPTSGIIEVANGVARNIDAYPDSANGYEFDEWLQISGTAVFDNEFSSSTNVTITGGAAEIQATFKLMEYTINLTDDGNGTTNLSFVTVEHGVASQLVTATADLGYEFVGWTETSGAGISYNSGSTDSTVYITAIGGDATLRANFTKIPYTLNISATTGGYVNPSGNRAVTYGDPYQLHAYARGTYKFENWTKIGGSGIVSFSPNYTDKDATVTVTGGDVSIRANFRKAVVNFSTPNVLPFPDYSTYPDSGQSIYQYGSNVYVYGANGSTNSVIREISLATVTSPIGTDSIYITGRAKGLIGNGTYLFAGSDVNLYKITRSGLTGLTTPSTATPVIDISRNYSNSSYFWAALSTGVIHDVAVSNLDNGWTILNSDSGYSYQNIQGVYNGLMAVRDDNGSHDLASYDVDAVTSATVYAADDTTLLHTGYDQDPGDAGKPVLGVDGEYMYVPVFDPDTGFKIRIYEVTDSTSAYYTGQVILTGEPLYIAVDDNYIYVAADLAGSAYIYVIDVYSKSSPIISKSHLISGFEKTDLVGRYGNYLYAVADTAAGKPTFYIYELSFD